MNNTEKAEIAARAILSWCEMDLDIQNEIYQAANRIKFDDVATDDESDRLKAEFLDELGMLDD